MRHIPLCHSLKGGSRPIAVGARLFAILLTLQCAIANAASPEEANQLVRGGASASALEMVTREQPAASLDANGWQAWERVRLAALAEQEAWQALETRISSYGPDIPDEFVARANGYRLQALLHSGRGAEAREMLRAALWQGVAPDNQARLRQAVIDSYLADGRVADAYAAWQRLRQDYPQSSEELQLLGARVCLLNARPLEALTLVADLDRSEARSLGLLARLRAGRLAPKAAIDEARAAIAWNPDEAPILRATAAEAAHAAGDRATAIVMLEQLFAGPDSNGDIFQLFGLTPDALWDAYLGLAQVALQQGHISGDEQVLKAADASAKTPVRRRALLAQVALKGGTVERREQAAKAFDEAILALPDGRRLLTKLWLHSARFAKPEQLPVSVRSQLMALGALAPVGAAPAAPPTSPAAATPPSALQGSKVERARIAIAAGDLTTATTLLKERVSAVPAVGQEEAEALLGALLLLRPRDEATAGELLDRYATGIQNPRLKREALFWLAESRLAQGRDGEAAELYLRAALLPGAEARDPLSQSARFQAARAFIRADRPAEAAAQYQRLLETTDDPDMKRLLQRALDQL